MPDEPTLGELKRSMEAGFASMNASLSKMVDQGVYAADQRRVEDRLADLKVDIAEEKAERAKIGTWVRWVAASVAIPVVLFVANLVQGKPS